MAILPAEEAIDRFKQNEERIDKFVNDADGYTTSGGQEVESISAFLQRVEGEIKAIGASGSGSWVQSFYDRVANVETTANATKERVDTVFEKLGGSPVYIGDGPIYPIVTDALNRVILGFNIETQVLVGSLAVAGSSGITRHWQGELPSELKPIAEDINHILFYGQSLSVGATGTPVLSTTQPYSNLTFNGGPRAYNGDYSAMKPLVEDALSPAPDGGTNRGETSCSGAANYASELGAIENGKDPALHAIFASTAGHGGYRIDQLEKGSAWYSYVTNHISNAKTLSDSASKSYAVHALAWLQGENNVGVGTSFAEYRADLLQLQRDVETDTKVISGQTSPVFLITYQMSYGIKTNANIALAQLDLALTDDRFALSTPMYHLPYAADNVHLTNVGYRLAGCYFGRAYKQLVIDGKRPKFINPVSVTARGTKVSLKFDVPVLPLILDPIDLASTQDYGFKVSDSSGALTLSDFSVVNGDTVEFTVNRALASSPVVRYAMDYLGIGLSITDGASGNLRDSEPATTTIGATTYKLFNVCPHFQSSIIKLS